MRIEQLHLPRTFHRVQLLLPSTKSRDVDDAREDVDLRARRCAEMAVASGRVSRLERGNSQST